MSDIRVNGEPLAICWGSNSPRAAYSYGGTTALVIPTLRDQLGCRMAVSATYGEMAGVVNWFGIPVYPQGFQLWGNDIHAANAKQHGAHILLTHQDVPWQEPETITRGGTRWVPWFPIDASPLAPPIGTRLDPTYCYQPIVLSRFGEQVAREAGLDVRFVPQGVKTRAYGDDRLDAVLPPFVPGDRAAARAALGWRDDVFVVGMVATNSGYPNRKAYPQQLRAFRAFAERHTDACLYIHAYGNADADPRVVSDLTWHLGEELCDSGRVLWAHPYDLNQGYSVAAMVTRYQAFDVLLGVSMAEGCGLPLLEAQACGIPVIAGDWSGMAENVYAGWKVAIDESVEWPVDPLRTHWRLPRVDAIGDRLEQAYDELQSDDARTRYAIHARAQIEAHHDQAFITDHYWRAVLTELAARIEAEPLPWHVHRWAGYGHPTQDGAVIAPCLVAGCPAERRFQDGAKAVYERGAPLVIGGIALDIQDDPTGGVARAIAAEVEQVYRLQDITLDPGAIVIDIGAHVGVVSCYLAKRFPQARIFAYEPHPENFTRLLRNLDANGCANVFCYPHAITADGRPLILHGDHTSNTGSYSAWVAGPEAVAVESKAIGDVWQAEGWGAIALMKLDCEGAEYEILRALNGELPSVQRLVMEVHENSTLRAAYGMGADLVRYAQHQIGTVRASIIQIGDMPAPSVRSELP